MSFFHNVAPAALFTLAAASASSKRGLCFVTSRYPSDNAIWIPATGSNLTWYYNYKPIPTPEYKDIPDLEFVPMLWGMPLDGPTSSAFYDSILAQLDAGANITHVLGFNEPDGSFWSGGSNIAPHAAAQVWTRQLEPLKQRGVQVGAPAVTGNTRGRQWLRDFFAACNGSCNPDFLPVHLYGPFEDVASRVGETTVLFPGMPIWITEFGFPNQTMYETVRFFNRSLSMFDEWSNITRYSYFGAFRSDVSNVGRNAAMLTERGKLTNIGSWYLGGNRTNNIPLSAAPSLSEAFPCTLVFVLTIFFAFVFKDF